jgi:transcriptional regulator with PAS, ATPase and Fis domain
MPTSSPAGGLGAPADIASAASSPALPGGGFSFNAADQLVGSSSAIQSIRDIAASVASRRCTVLMMGETGTGKEMLARFVHEHSDRASRPFITVDCSALTDTLFESQLFGHTRGAFTGAVRDSLGFVRAAEGGTLFLDEIGELAPASQAKLLRVIQERSVIPVGDTRPRPVDVRILAATHRDLRVMVQQGTFREDLYFRINVVTIHVPPLRERVSDVLPLAQRFLRLQSELYGEPLKRLSPDACDAMLRYTWPGNVRELANAIEHAYVLSSCQDIQLVDLPERIRAVGTSDRVAFASELCLADLERRAIAEALRRTHYNKSAAAKLLGIHIQKLSRRIEKLKVRVPNE